jgi:hypothetical protein
MNTPAAFLFVVAIAGCGGGAPPKLAPVERALAGAAIYESHAAPRPPTPAQPLHSVGEMRWPGQRGEPLFVLVGGALPRPIAVPLLFTPDDDPEGKCAFHNEGFFFALDDGRVYIGQYNSWCGGEACLILEPASGRFAPPAGGCVEPGFGIHWRAEPVGRGWIAVYSSAEGMGQVAFGAYSPEAGFTPAVELGLGHSGDVEGRMTEQGPLLTSRCDLAGAGCGMFDDAGAAPLKTFRLGPAGRLSPLD